MKGLSYSFSMLMLFLLLTSSCEDLESQQKALVNVLLIDEPGSFEQVWVEVLGVEVLPTGSRGQENADWLFIPYTPSIKTVSLTELIADQRLLLGRKEIQSGQIIGVRLVLGDNNYLISQGERVNLQPSTDFNNRLTLDVNFNVPAGFSFDLYLDFSVVKSIRQADSGGWELSPSIRAFDASEVTEIRGTVQPANSYPMVYAISERDTITTLAHPQRGEFRLRGLPPATYTVIIQPNINYLDTAFQVSPTLDSLVQLGNLPIRERTND
ncbi:DUF4382 domain-containing protein [Pleomorphovibrio marinus]|uniref:DUF4382 domain-containing protein n=1 Tax=Pleomorphovibrio marinus TaxID=2164132 RepID=UPI000E0A08B5|nr:DUF4382 domain-containing protein [Pleomorphovibrio marinus]